MLFLAFDAASFEKKQRKKCPTFSYYSKQLDFEVYLDPDQSITRKKLLLWWKALYLVICPHAKKGLSFEHSIDFCPDIIVSSSVLTVRYSKCPSSDFFSRIVCLKRPVYFLVALLWGKMIIFFFVERKSRKDCAQHLQRSQLKKFHNPLTWPKHRLSVKPYYFTFSSDTMVCCSLFHVVDVYALCYFRLRPENDLEIKLLRSFQVSSVFRSLQLSHFLVHAGSWLYKVLFC